MSGKKLEFVQSVVVEAYRREFEPVTTQDPPMEVKGVQELMKSYHSATLKTARQVGESLSLISQDSQEIILKEEASHDKQIEFCSNFFTPVPGWAG